MNHEKKVIFLLLSLTCSCLSDNVLEGTYGSTSGRNGEEAVGFSKLACQKGFSGVFLPDLVSATKTCKVQESMLLECFQSCIAHQMGLLTPTGFDANRMVGLLGRQLSGPGGSDNVVRIAVQFKVCSKRYNSTILQPCEKQQGLWSCFDRVLNCNA